MVIIIDKNRCLGAENCGKCMRICSLGVYMNVPIGKFIPGKLPEKFEIIPFFDEICNGCGACIEVCSQKCIKIKL